MTVPPRFASFSFLALETLPFEAVDGCPGVQLQQSVLLNGFELPIPAFTIVSSPPFEMGMAASTLSAFVVYWL